MQGDRKARAPGLSAWQGRLCCGWVLLAGLGLLLMAPAWLDCLLVGWAGLRHWVWSVAVSVLSLTALFAWMREPRRWLPLLLPLLLLAFVDLGVMFQIHSRLSTSVMEAMLGGLRVLPEFLRVYAPVLVPGVVLFVALALLLLRGLTGLRKPRQPRLALATLALVAVAWGVQLGRAFEAVGTKELMRSVVQLLILDQSAPFGVLSRGVATVAIRLQRDDVLEARQARHDPAWRVPDRLGDRVVVLVIGESSRPQNWSLFGYTRRTTTPRLAALDGQLALLRGLTTSAPVTALAVPSIVSLYGRAGWDAVLAHPSILPAFGQAGYDTYWYSAQGVDPWSGTIPIVAAEAAHTHYYDPWLDDALLEPLQQVLDRGRSAFVVLHTRGSHWEYRYSYPQSFRIYQAEGGDRHEVVRAEYDNSIRHTDAMLAEVIAHLERSRLPSALIYVSDHGDNLWDTPAGLFGHAIGNAWDLPTVGLVWLSPSWQARDPQVFGRIRAHACRLQDTGVIAPTLLQLGGVRTPAWLASDSLADEAYDPPAARFHLGVSAPRPTAPLVEPVACP